MDPNNQPSGHSVYGTAQPAPEDHIQTINQSGKKPEALDKPSFGLDSPLGLLASGLTAPLYLHSSLRGKHVVWDELLAEVPDALFYQPALDVGCGRGMVLLKIAERKKKLAASASAGPSAQQVTPAYGIDIFTQGDQTGNSPVATYQNAAAAGVLDHVVLNTADFTQKLPFADGAFSLITSSLAIHNVSQEGQLLAIQEIARVLAPGGKVVIVDLFKVKDHYALLKSMGWTDVHTKGAGPRMLYGVLPCQILTATKPETAKPAAA